MIQPQVILPQQQQQQLYPNPNLQHTRKISNPPVINTNVAKSASSGSATSPYVPKAGPYAPSANRKTHSRANSLVGAKGKELNPYAPVLPIVNQANMNSTSLPTGVIPPSNPVAPPAIGPYQHGSVPQQQMVPQQFSQNSQASLPLPTQNRIRGLSFTKSRLGQPAPKVQDPNALLQRQFPIFSWSNSGNIASLIPNKNTNVYGNFVNETINVGSVTKLLSFNESISSFPGPLSKSSSKTKKKDVEKWLENNIDVINKTSSIVQPDEILLNQILLALIQNNGDVSAKQFIESVCPILNPTVNYKSELPPVEIQPIHNIATPTAYKLDNSGLNSLLNYLQVGKTEEAIQLCVSKGDWAMALMISNIVGNEKFQKIASDYARMSFPFQVSQSKIHHLMPIVLKAINGASKSVIQDFLNVATEGDWATQHWRDIVSLIFINGSANALEFCIEFGKFLRGRPGLAIASDICFMLAGIPLNQSVSTANGVVFPIIGGETYLSSIYTEIYEMSIQLSPVNIQVGANGFPHLYPAKLKYAQILADYGLFAESQKYCDLLIPLLKPAGSSGGHQSLIWHELQNLALRLSSTNDQDQSWFGNRISKVNLDKMWGHLDKFIGGEEAKPKGEGVFSKFSPSVSRNTSTLDFAALGNTNNYNNPTTNNLPHHVRQQNYQSTMNNASDMSTSLNFSAPATSDSSYPLNGRVNAPPPLARTNTSSSMQRYAPGSHTNIQLHQHSQSQLQSQQQSQPQVPTQHQTSQVHQIPSQSASAPLVEDRHNYGYGLPQPSFESNPRYAPSNLSSLSLPLNQPDTHVKRVQKERFSPRISHNAPIVESPFAYMNPAGKISTLSIGSSYQATQNFSNPPQPIFHQPEGARRQSLEQPPTSVGNSVVPQPEESQQPQQYPTEQREDVYQAQNHIPLLQTTPQPFPPSIKKRNSIVSVTTENFGNPDAIRAQNHSPSAQSDISLDYEFKSNSRKYGEFNLIESPEKKRREGEHSQDSTDLTSVKEEVKKETQQLPPPPPPQSQQVELQQDEPQTEEVKEDELPPPPPPVLAKPPSTRSPASLLLKRANPYAPGGGSRAPSIRKNRYGPPTGTKSEFIPPVPQGDMFSYGGYQISTESDLQKVKETPTVENVEPKAESHDVSRPANVDVSFEEEETQTITTPQPKLFNRNQNFGGNNSPMKPPSVFNHYQGEVESSPNAGFGEFPVPGTPDYTTRANSVIGGNGGYYSSRLSQSHQSAMYQQYEVEDDTVKDFVPVVEEEDEDDEYLEKKEKELRLKQAEEAAKAKAAAAELEAKKQKKQQEEDAKRAKEEAESKKRNTHEGEGQSSGWFGSWLGRDDGKPKAIRAKLGEKSSFYYDEKLKKWINKDIPLEDQLKPSGPPPPPKMKKAESTPKSDGPSGSLPPGPPGGKPHGPPGGIPLTEQSINSQAGNSSSSPISSSGPPSKGPSLATAGLDDLLSIDTPSVGSTRKGKRGPKRGYVNVLTQE